MTLDVPSRLSSLSGGIDTLAAQFDQVIVACSQGLEVAGTKITLEVCLAVITLLKTTVAVRDALDIFYRRRRVQRQRAIEKRHREYMRHRALALHSDFISWPEEEDDPFGDTSEEEEEEEERSSDGVRQYGFGPESPVFEVGSTSELPLTWLLSVSVRHFLPPGTFPSSSHSLRYLYTVLEESDPEQPEITVLGYADDQLISRYDSNSRQIQPKVAWMSKMDAEDPQHWDKELQRIQSWGLELKEMLNTTMKLKSRYRGKVEEEEEGYMEGCEFFSDGSKEGYAASAYDGRDFLAFDRPAASWRAIDFMSQILRLIWVMKSNQTQKLKSYLEEECIEQLRKYLEIGKEALLRKDGYMHNITRKEGEDEEGREVGSSLVVAANIGFEGKDFGNEEVSKFRKAWKSMVLLLLGQERGGVGGGEKGACPRERSPLLAPEPFFGETQESTPLFLQRGSWSGSEMEGRDSGESEPGVGPEEAEEENGVDIWGERTQEKLAEVATESPEAEEIPSATREDPRDGGLEPEADRGGNEALLGDAQLALDVPSQPPSDHQTMDMVTALFSQMWQSPATGTIRSRIGPLTLHRLDPLTCDGMESSRKDEELESKADEMQGNKLVALEELDVNEIPTGDS
ncbi:hypothetical protein JD844_013973, partial [Phrynosoma platyrhinos]